VTRKDWETQRRNRCEDMVNKDMYESLTKDAFKGVPKRDSDKWGLTLSVRSSTLDPDELEVQTNCLIFLSFCVTPDAIGN